MNDPILHDPPTPFAAEFPLRQPEAQPATAKVVPLLARIPLRLLTERNVQEALRDEAINQRLREEMTPRRMCIRNLMALLEAVGPEPIEELLGAVEAYDLDTVKKWFASLRQTVTGQER